MTTCDVYGCDRPAEVEDSRGGETVRLCRQDWDAPLVAIRGVGSSQLTPGEGQERPKSEWPDDAPDEEAPQQCAVCGAGYVSLAAAARCCGGDGRGA